VVSADHDDYPALVAEALDRLQALAFDMPATADALCVTTTQLLKLFKKTPAAWTTLNRLRIGQGMSPLK
jgi:hypothetical protein